MFKQFNNLNDFEAAFPDEEACINHYRAVRWPNGIACPYCGSLKVYDLKMGKHKCGEKACAEKFTVRHDSIFTDSKLPLRTWFKAIFLMTSHKKGISSIQLGKDLGITQKSAWHLLHRVREATTTEEFKRPVFMTGTTIQADESFLGGKEQFKHANKRTPFSEGRGSVRSKTMIFAMLSNSGELRMQKIPHLRRNEIEPIIKRNARMGTAMHTDEATHYKWMQGMYEHSLVKHRMGEYVAKDGTTTNGVEGVFSHFKRAVTGVYHKVSDEQVDRYLSMFAWRWTRRKMGEGERVNSLLESTKGHQLPYRKLIRKDGMQ